MNEFSHYVLESILLIFSLLIFYVFKSYFPKYFETKATNQATKEDIGEITKTVENIKSQLLQQNELLKAELSLANQHKIAIKSAEREAIFDFNKQKSVWIYSLIRFSFFKYELENYREIYRETYLEYQTKQYEYELAAAHLTLFMYDDEFIDLKEKLITEVIELHKIVTSTIYSIFDVFAQAEIRFNLDKDNLSEQSIIRNEMIQRLLATQKTHKEDTEKQFEKVEALDLQMRDLLWNRLKILENTTNS